MHWIHLFFKSFLNTIHMTNAHYLQKYFDLCLHMCCQLLVSWERLIPLIIYNQECPTLESQSTSEQNEVVEFIERVSQEEDLVGDGSTSHSLPTIPGKHADLKSITTDTVRAYVTVIYWNYSIISFKFMQYIYIQKEKLTLSKRSLTPSRFFFHL